MLKRLAARLPDGMQAELKRVHFRRQIRLGLFTADEPEFDMLPELITPGDWIIDVGANVGHYTRRFSELAGRSGRVFAFEPVPKTFALLAANLQLMEFENVTLVNAAVSDRTSTVSISIPTARSGLKNFYEASISRDDSAGLNVMSIALDAFGFASRIALVKIDAEGHERSVVAGMRTIITAHRPTLIIETSAAAIIDELAALSYSCERLPGSPNRLFRPL